MCFTPFLVAIDDDSKAIVVAIRGTLSPEDMIVDMLAEGKRLDPENLPDDFPPDMEHCVHYGILRTACQLRAYIVNKHLIETARLRRPDYPLVVCGHSLGAGVASVLGFLLRKQYPEVKAYAYSPPLGLMK